MPGRRRSFDKEATLDKLMNLFWRYGYAGTSMSHLTEETGLTKPSLYAAYGNKEAMYCASLERYLQMQSEDVYSVLMDDTLDLTAILSDFLKATAKAATRPDRPAGCFIAGASCDAAAELLPDTAHSLISQINSMGDDMLTNRLKPLLESEGKAKHDPEELVKFIQVLQNGIVQMAIQGEDYASLEATVDLAIEGMR